tara:strand:+ start:454 stop:2217 length:1764 start_codon:yes stop_codon:yes gene_type:complete
MSSLETLDPKVNTNVQVDRENRTVITALDVVERFNHSKTLKDQENSSIQDLFEAGFQIHEPFGPRKINSKMLQQAIWRIISRMKPLDFTIHGSNRPQEIETMVTAGVGTVLENGGYAASLRDKQGAFFNRVLFGDDFTLAGAGDASKGVPIEFMPIDNTNVWVDPFATVMRGRGRSVSKMVVVFSYSWAEFIKLYPKGAKIAGPGKIPRQRTSSDDYLNRDNEQEIDLDSKTLIEVAHYFDISNKAHAIFAGDGCTVLEEHKGEDYPYMINGEPYIPVIHGFCQPSSEGFYNHGVGSMIFDIAKLSQQLMNLAMGHIVENTFPLQITNMPEGTQAQFFKKLGLAQKQRAAGQQAFVTMEYDPNNPQASQVQSQTLLTESLTGEWQAMWEQLTRELNRLGINLDELDRGNVTATQVISEEESQNAFVKQMMEYNASESKFTIELAMDFITQFVKKSNKTPIHSTTQLEVEGRPVDLPPIPIGLISQELSDNNYFVRINARTGAIPSNILQQAQIARTLQATPPGTPAFFKLMKEFAQLNDRDYSLEDFGFQQQVGAAPGIDDTLEAPAAAQTERQRVSRGQLQEQPAL